MNSRCILFAPSTGLVNLSDEDQFLKWDGRNSIFLSLKQKFLERGIETLLFDDEVNYNDQDILLFWNARNENLSYIKGNHPCKFIIISEPKLTVPNNYRDLSLFKDFKKCFTYHNPLVDHKKYIKINYPNKFPKTINYEPYGSRNGIVMIAGHKKARKHKYSQGELYSERIKAIRWFEKFYPLQFHLYGIGWDKPYFSNRILRKLHKYPDILEKIPFHKYSSYKGLVENKYSVLSKAKFSICFENQTGFEGYITEKIFDCFFAGVIPIYWGEENIRNIIPFDAYLVFSDFKSMQGLYDYLQNIDEKMYTKYQDAMLAFLNSASAQEFEVNMIANKIVDEVVATIPHLN